MLMSVSENSIYSLQVEFNAKEIKNYPLDVDFVFENNSFSSCFNVTETSELLYHVSSSTKPLLSFHVST